MNTIPNGFWSGIAEVIPRPGNGLLGGADGAYVGVVGSAASRSDFLNRSKRAFAAMEFDVIEVADVEFIESIEEWANSDEIMRERAASLTTSNPIEFGSFHCFKDSD